MALTEAEKIVQRATAGEQITAKERRHVVGYWMGTAPDMTNQQIADAFRVTEGQIRLDKKNIREEKARLLKEDDIGLIIADIVLTFERQVRDIESSKTKCDKGTRSYLEHCKSIFTLQKDMVKALQDLGYYPKNLGNLTIEKYDYKAIVTKDGNVDTRRIEMTEPRAIQDAEFVDLPALPPASPANQHENTKPQSPAPSQ